MPPPFRQAVMARTGGNTETAAVRREPLSARTERGGRQKMPRADRRLALAVRIEFHGGMESQAGTPAKLANLYRSLSLGHNPGI